MALTSAVVCSVSASPKAAKAPRVVAARASKGKAIKQMFTDVGIAYPAKRLLIRAFKRDEVVELWAGNRSGELVLVKTYPVCANSGALGPKRQRGDLQVPEGFYVIDRFNPWSTFHLSLGVNYPNKSDRKLGTARDLGGDIFVHGNCVTIGCIPIEDGPIEELFIAALDAHAAGLKRVPVHIFPTRMDGEGMAFLEEHAGDDARLMEFWKNLRPGYLAFEKNRKVPRIRVNDTTGRYRVQPGG